MTRPDGECEADLTAGTDAPGSHSEHRLPCCAEIMALGPWRKLSGTELRWAWQGPADRDPAFFVGPEIPIQRFPSAQAGQSIHIVRCQDGGLISYQLGSDQWLHTLNTTSAFRYRVFELNLVPLIELGPLLGRA